MSNFKNPSYTITSTDAITGYSEPGVNHPDHYNQGNIECIDAMVSAYGSLAVTDFCLCNAFKYLWRCNNKHSFNEDLGKAKWYIDKALELTNKQ